MNYADQNYTTTKLITLLINDNSEFYPMQPMTQSKVARFCEACALPIDAYVDGEWVGSTEL